MAAPVSTQFGVAVHVLTLLATVADERTSAEALARSVGANPVHVRRVLSGLARAGIVTSRPGPGGGWRLTRAAASVTLADAYAAVAADQPVLGLHDAAPGCDVGQRIAATLRDIERGAAAALTAQLAGTTVEDLAGAAHAGDWRPAA